MTESSNSSTSYFSESSEDRREDLEPGESLARTAETDGASGINSNDSTSYFCDSSDDMVDDSKSVESLARMAETDSTGGNRSLQWDCGLVCLMIRCCFSHAP